MAGCPEPAGHWTGAVGAVAVFCSGRAAPAALLGGLPFRSASRTGMRGLGQAGKLITDTCLLWANVGHKIPGLAGVSWAGEVASHAQIYPDPNSSIVQVVRRRESQIPSINAGIISRK